MANLYQDALTEELGRPKAPGFVAPGDMKVDQPVQAPASGGSLQDILGKYQYGAKGLADAEKDLTAAGYQLQKDSSGRVRGRLKGPNGDIIDVIGQGEGNDWWNNQTGSAWNINNRGQEGLDAGGWSFGGGGGGFAPMMDAPDGPSMGLDQLLSGDPSARIQQALSQFSGRSPNIEALLAQLAAK